MKSFLGLLLFSVSTIVYGQSGNYFLSHHSPSQERFDYVCFDMAQDSKGVMYFATKAGILEFDGRDWDLLQGHSAIYSIQIDEAGTMYWAGTKGFGKIGLDKHGFQQIQSLSDSTVANVFQSVIVSNNVFFLTEDAVYALDPKTGKTAVIKKTAPENTFLRIFELFGVAYVNTENGIFKIENNKLVPANLNIDEEVIFFSRIEGTYVLGTASNKIYSCDNHLKLKQIAVQDQVYMDASVIVSGSWINRQLLAIGTLRGGVIFINPINGVTQEITNYSTGLPDNEVFEMMTDVNHNVWVAHDYGFTQISPFMPLGSFSHYEGLQGNLLCAYSSQNTVYVGTSLGLFRLQKLDVYDEIVYYMEVPIKEAKKNSLKNGATTPPPKEEVKQEIPKAESKKGGLFSFLKRNKKNKPEDTAGKVTAWPQSSKPGSLSAENKVRYRREKRIEKVIRSSQFVFKKVQGIDAKITHLVDVQGRLLASGLSGLYEVSNQESKQLIEEPIRFIYSPSGSDQVLVSTYSDEVRVLRFTGNVIENASLFSNLEDQIHSVFEGKNELWLCGLNKIYRAETKNGDIRHKQTVELIQQNIDKTVGVVINNEVILANANGFFHYDRKKNGIGKIDTLPQPSQYFAHNGSIVYHDQHGWNFLGGNGNAENSLHLLNVFEDLRFITSDKNPQNLWIISGKNELFKFFGDRVIPTETEFPLFLKSIFYQDRKIVNHSEIHMDQEHSSVKFKVVQPDYTNPSAIEFRYLLKGMQRDWSEWSNSNNEISFPYLPTGDYTLQVQAKNIFGKITELAPVTFEVLPPYWRRPWFYALEFSVFASLVMLSFRLSTRYRIISRVLSLLTIILLIEFIQTVIGETILTKNSPVIDFFIQVVVALLVLPVEGYLRNLMLRSLDSSGKFYKFIVPGAPVTRASKEKPETFIRETSDVD
jgi:outer membrane protein assembly factor BamB